MNIGYSCQLLSDDLVDVFVVDASTYDEVQQQLLKFKDNIRIVNTFHPCSPSGIQIGATNGKLDSSHRLTGESTPPQARGPPAVSVVTFRWEYALFLFFAFYFARFIFELFGKIAKTFDNFI